MSKASRFAAASPAGTARRRASLTASGGPGGALAAGGGGPPAPAVRPPPPGDPPPRPLLHLPLQVREGRVRLLPEDDREGPDLRDAGDHDGLVGGPRQGAGGFAG